MVPNTSLNSPVFQMLSGTKHFQPHVLLFLKKKSIKFETCVKQFDVFNEVFRAGVDDSSAINRGVI